MKALRLSVPCLLLPLMLSACTVRQGSFTVLSTKLVRLSNFDVDGAPRAKGVEGKDVAHIILFIPTKGQVTPQEAVDRALEAGGGDLMTDAVLYNWGWYIPYIYGQMGWRARGDVIKTRLTR